VGSSAKTIRGLLINALARQGAVLASWGGLQPGQSSPQGQERDQAPPAGRKLGEGSIGLVPGPLLGPGPATLGPPTRQGRATTAADHAAGQAAVGAHGPAAAIGTGHGLGGFGSAWGAGESKSYRQDPAPEAA
jgi:hypothetical protein